MRRPQNLMLPILGGIFTLITLLCLYAVVKNLWVYARMRSVPVEVTNSSLLIDSPADRNGNLQEPEYTLRLDFLATDGSGRTIHWEDAAGHAAYPEEALDELERWKPGTKHTVHQLRGEARAIRLPGSADNQELTVAITCACIAAFLGFFAITLLALSVETETWAKRSWIGRTIGVWLVFFTVGVCMSLVTVLFAANQIPKIISWPKVTAAISEAPGSYELSTLPPNVTMTPAARTRLASSPHKVITFPWNGATVHGGVGHAEGIYDVLAGTCSSAGTTCELSVNPKDRWDIAQNSGWNSNFFAPLGMFALFGVAFSWAGLLIRKNSI